MSDDRIWVFPYKMASASAKLLAEKLDCLRIKNDGSNFHGKKGQFILAWGAGTGVYNADTGGATLLNPPNLIDKAINKIGYFKTMTEVGGPRVPYWTTSPAQAKQWLGEGHQVVARRAVDSQRGYGIHVMKNLLDFIHAPLYTIKVTNVHEYRVYMWKDEVIDVRLKVGVPDRDGMMVGDDIEFPVFDDWENKTPPDVLLQARKAAKFLPLATQGLDIIWDGRKAYVLETNTAPYLGIQTANKYARRIKQFLDKEAA